MLLTWLMFGNRIDDSGLSSPQIHPSIHTSSYQSLLLYLETGGRLLATLQYQRPGLLSSVRSSVIVIKWLLRLGSTTLSIMMIPAGKTYPSISMKQEKERLWGLPNLTYRLWLVCNKNEHVKIFPMFYVILTLTHQLIGEWNEPTYIGVWGVWMWRVTCRMLAGVSNV